MNRRFLTGTILLASVVSLTLCGQLRAGEQIAFEASGLRVHLSLERIPGGYFITNSIPDGESNLGDWEGYVELTRKANFITGMMEISFDPGNTLTLYFEQRYHQQIGDFGGYVGAYQITGGSGRFRNAGGAGTITAVFLDRDAVDVLITLEGVIELP